MVHWPPQPCVEDEVTSLEHEQIPPGMVEDLKSDDDPAVSRGAVDQTPIIADTNKPESTAHQNTGIDPQPNQPLPRTNSYNDGNIRSAARPLDQHGVHQPSPTGQSKDLSFSNNPASQAAASNEHSRGRPEVSRIDTALGADLHAMGIGGRRAPSPYSYSRGTGTYTATVPQVPQTSSPVNLRPSPVQDQSSRSLRFSPSSATETRAVLSDEPDTTGRERRRHRSKSRARSRSHPRESSTQRDGRTSRRKASESSSEDDARFYRRGRKESKNTAPPPPASLRYHTERETFTPPHSRRQSKDSYYASGGEEHLRGSTYERRSDRRSYESPYVSSNDEAGKASRVVGEKTPEVSRYSSSNRRERPHLDSFPDIIRSRKSVQTSADDISLVSREPRRRSNLDPMTPMTADAARSMEDYFERAFMENEFRRSKVERNYRTSGSAISSPVASPPRTPRSERQSRDYFETDVGQRTSRSSRPPSIDENQLSALRSHTSLLSAATTGAALAARGPADQSQPPRMSNANRSSRPSQVVEERSAPAYAAGISRGTEPSHPRPPQRAASYSGYDQPRGILKNSHSAIGHDVHANLPSTANNSSSNGLRSSTYSAQASDSTTQRSNVLRLPICPRAKPVSGYKDWYSIKEMSNLDICPTCMDALRNTRFSHLFVPSLPRPYNEASVCVMSKPWPRIALMRAHLQKRSDLSYLRALSMLPKDTRACAGSKSDLRSWFNIVDPSTRDPIPNFAACSACVRAIDIVFPELHNLLDRQKDAPRQEKVCSLHTDSKHFPVFIDQFEQTATRCGPHGWRSADIQPLANMIRKACRFQECSRDKLLSTRAWHFMPDLPEFTICEECYEDVVWPVNDRPIARDISKTLKLVPARRSLPGSTGISCQLYSERMRKIFRNAVATRTIGPLRDAAKTRQAAQLRLHEMNNLYEADQKYGIDRRTEIGKNNAIWRSLE